MHPAQYTIIRLHLLTYSSFYGNLCMVVPLARRETCGRSRPRSLSLRAYARPCLGAVGLRLPVLWPGPYPAQLGRYARRITNPMMQNHMATLLHAAEI